MLYQLGEVVFEVAPFNVDSIEKSSSTDSAWKPVFGAPERAEYVGEGAETMTLHGRLFPQALGGLDVMRLLHEQRVRAGAQFLMRGDGVPMGWFLIEKVAERSTYLDSQGVGRMIEFDIELRRTWRPTPEEYYAALQASADGWPTPPEILANTWGEDPNP